MLDGWKTKLMFRGVSGLTVLIAKFSLPTSKSRSGAGF